MKLRPAPLAPVLGRARTVAPALALALLLGPLSARVLAGGGGPFLRIEIDEHKKGGTQVRLNIPLAAAEIALDLAQNEALSGGRFRFDTKSVKVADLKRMWNALKLAGDTDLVEAKDGDETVRVSQRGGRVQVEVLDRGKAKVNVDVPAAAIDALFSGDGDVLDLRAALAELNADARGELVRINDDDTNVRVWIE